MAEETKTSGQEQQDRGALTGDMSMLFVSVGTFLDSTIEPMSKIVAQTLDSMAVVAKQVLEGVNTTLGSKK
jgi:hypothetical protein